MSEDSKKVYVKDGLRRIVLGEQLILSVGVDHNSFTNPESDHSLHYTWTKDGIPFGNEEGQLSYHDIQHPASFWDRPTITLDDIQVEDSGIYQCEITNAFGSVLSEPTTVEVLDALNSPLLTRNLVQNGEMKQGEAGWNVIEGSMEQIDPYFWDGIKRKGFASTDNMTPKVKDIADEIMYPGPIDGDRLIAQFANRGETNEVKIQQEIDLTSITDVIDRNIEGITSVDLKVGAWLSSKRFHPYESYGYLQTKDNGDADWARATTDVASWDDESHQLNSYFFIRCLMYIDMLNLTYTLFNDKGDEIRRIKLTNVPTSYTKSLSAFKHRRIDLPTGTRKIRVEIQAQRDGGRLWDKRLGSGTASQFFNMIAVGCWGINARIYVNNIGDDFNTTYRTWDMPEKRYLNPAVLSFVPLDGNLFRNAASHFWETEADEHGIKKDISFKKASWMGYPTFPYKKTNGDMRIPIKWFDVWKNASDDTPYDDSYWTETQNYDTRLEGWKKVSKTWHKGLGDYVRDWWFGKPTTIHDAALAHLNMKNMNTQWLKDYNLNRMDEQGKSYMLFQFNSPVIVNDQESFSTMINKRRKLIIPGAGPEPLISQTVYLEDLDQIIYDMHANTTQFHLHLNKLETKVACWWREDYYYLNRNIYDPLRSIQDANLLPGYNFTWDGFISGPRSNSELEQFYWALTKYYWYILEIPITETIQTSTSEISDLRSALYDKLKINEILNEFKIHLGIPEEFLINREAQLMLWVKKRLVTHILDTIFRSVNMGLKGARGSEEYKEALDYSRRDKISQASDDRWRDSGDLD